MPAMPGLGEALFAGSMLQESTTTNRYCRCRTMIGDAKTIPKWCASKTACFAS
jgi:hypothetical protein